MFNKKRQHFVLPIVILLPHSLLSQIGTFRFNMLDQRMLTILNCMHR